MKICMKCKVEKDESEYHKNKSKRDGIGTWCKTCVRSYNQTEEGINKRRDRERLYLLTPEGMEKYRARKLRDKTNRAGKYLARDIEYRKNNPERYKAGMLLNGALRSGRIKREPCRVCGAARVDGHHRDYSKPFEVIWLCRSHHRMIHGSGVTTAPVVAA